MHTTIGKFKISIGDPSPIWIDITCNNQTIRFSHYDLRDLEYAVQKILTESRNRLPDHYKYELDKA